MGSDVEMESASSISSSIDMFDELDEIRELWTSDSNNVEVGNRLLESLSKTNSMDELEETRSSFVEWAPLNATNWKNWIEELRERKASYEKIEEMFERAFCDTNDISIWLEMVYFSFSHGVATTRQTCEKALAAHGTRYDTSGHVWLVYLSFETEYAQANPTPENIQNLENLYKRALRVANKHLEDIYEDAQKLGDGCKEEFRKIFENTSKFVKKLEKFEEDLEKPDGYQKYLEFEIESGDPSRIQMMHERIVEAFPTDEYAWSAYCTWCEQQLKVNSITSQIYKRAIRQCFSSCFLYQQALLAYERDNKPEAEIDKIFEKGASSASNHSFDDAKSIFRTYIYLIRRRIAKSGSQDYTKVGEIFERASESLKKWFPHNYDLKADFRQNQAYFYAGLGKNIDKARQVWSDILASGFGKYAQKWIEAVKLERQFGDNDHARKYLTKALNSVSDNINEIYEYYIQFEREEGTLEQLETVLDKINSQVAHRAARPQKAPKPVEEKKEKHGAVKRAHAGSGNERNDRKLKTGEFKQPIVASASSTSEPTHSSNSEEGSRTVFVSNLDFGTTEDDIKKVLEGVEKIRFAKRAKGDLHRGFGYVVLKSVEFSKKAVKNDRVMVNGRPMFVSVNDPEKRVGFKYSQGLEKAKLFVRNVHFKANEDELTKLFSEYGTVANVRIVRHKNGQPKGVAYVDFETEEAATKALMATKIELRDRELSVALSNPPTKTEKKPDAPAPSTDPQLEAPEQSSQRKAMLQFVPRAAKPAPTPSTSTSTSIPTSTSNEPPKHKPMSNDMFRQFLKKST